MNCPDKGRSALQNAASISGLLLTTECLITEIPEKKAPAGGGGHHGRGSANRDISPHIYPYESARSILISSLARFLRSRTTMIDSHEGFREGAPSPPKRRRRVIFHAVRFCDAAAGHFSSKDIYSAEEVAVFC